MVLRSLVKMVRRNDNRMDVETARLVMLEDSVCLYNALNGLGDISNSRNDSERRRVLLVAGLLALDDTFDHNKGTVNADIEIDFQRFALGLTETARRHPEIVGANLAAYGGRLQAYSEKVPQLQGVADLFLEKFGGYR